MDAGGYHHLYTGQLFAGRLSNHGTVPLPLIKHTTTYTHIQHALKSYTTVHNLPRCGGVGGD